MSTRISLAYGQVTETPQNTNAFHVWVDDLRPSLVAGADHGKFPVVVEFLVAPEQIERDGCVVRVQISRKLAADLVRQLASDAETFVLLEER